jgi:hypothetical protein
MPLAFSLSGGCSPPTSPANLRGALVWEDGEGKVWLTYRRVRDLARYHHVAGHDEAVKTLDEGRAGLARAAIAQ